MLKIYKCNKLYVTLLFLSILSLLGGLIVAIGISKLDIIYKSFYILGIIIICSLCLSQVIKEFRMFIQVDNSGIVYKRYKQARKVSWSNITRLEFEGINFKTLTPYMRIHIRGEDGFAQAFDEYEDFLVDYNFKNCKVIWGDIIESAQQYNNSIIIDKDLRDKLIKTD